jgi:hypothetical protein
VVDAFPPRRHAHHAAAAFLAAVLALGGLYGLRYLGGMYGEWREASRFLQTSVGPRDTLLFSSGGSQRADSPPARLDMSSRNRQLLVRRYDPEARLSVASRITLREATGSCGPDPTPCLDRSLGALDPGRAVWMIWAHDRARPSVRAWFERHLELTDSRAFKGVLVERWVIWAR